MKRKLNCWLIILCIMLLIGCAKVEIYPKNVEIEIGSVASENILDYVCIESDRSDRIRNKAELDISNIDVMNVGEYVAKITYGREEVIVPVSVVDTTAPIINVKEKEFQEGDQVIAEDLAEAIDDSNVTLSLLSNPGGVQLDFTTLQYGESVTLKAEDQFGNETVKEIVLNIRPKENSSFPEERSYERLEDFPYGELQYVDEKIYAEIKSAYENMEWYSDFSNGNIEQNQFYKEKYKELLDGKVTFLKTDRYTYSEVSQRLYLSEFLRVEEDYPPEDLFNGGNDQYGLCFFDMDLDNEPELCIAEKAGAGIRSYYIFKYRKDIDEIVLWKTLNGANIQIMGSGIIGMAWEDQHFVFSRLNESGEEAVLIYFIRDFFHESGKFVYMVSLPKYKEMDQQIEVTDEMQKQGYYDKSQDLVFFCVSEEQYQELIRDFLISYESAKDNIENVTYTYRELFEKKDA